MAKPLKIKKISPTDRPEKAARRILRTRLREFYACWPNPDHAPTPEQLHNLRISGKRLRYSAEVLREFYPDRLALLMTLLKGAQDLLGEVQDCVTQRRLIEAYIARMRRRTPRNDQIAALENIVSEYERRQSKLFIRFQDTWRGMVQEEFRASLNAMVSRIKKINRERLSGDDGRLPVLRVIPAAEIISTSQSNHDDQDGYERLARRRARKNAAVDSFLINKAGDESRAEAIVDIDDGDV